MTPHPQMNSLPRSPRPRDRADRLRARRDAMVSRLRREYFAEVGATALRYEVSLERAIEHVLDQPGAPGTMRYLDELLLIIACLDDHPRAWQDLESYEQALLGAPRLGDSEIDATLRVRRYFAALRQAVRLGDRQSMLVRGLAMYRGERPLRAWLLDGIASYRPEEIIDHPPCRMTGSS